MTRESSDFGPAIDWAKTAYELGRYQACLDFIAGMPAHRGVAELLYWKALCLAKLERAAEARAAAADPLLQSTLTPAARRRLDDVLAGRDLPAPPSRRERIMELWIVEKFDEALRLCDEALADDPRDALTLRWKGQCLISLGREEEARAALAAALARDPSDAEAIRLLSSIAPR